MTEHLLHRFRNASTWRRPWPTPIVALITLGLFVLAFGRIIGGGNQENRRQDPIIAGQEIQLADDSDDEGGPSSVSFQLVDITSESGPVSEAMARTGTYQGRFYVVSAAPGEYPSAEGVNPPANTIYTYDGISWSSDSLRSEEARRFLLPEEINEIAEGGPYDVGFLGRNYGSEAAFDGRTFRIREPSLLSQRATLTALVAEDADGERSEQRLSDMMAGSDVDAEGHIMERVVGGDVGLVVVTTKSEGNDETHLLLFSPDGTNWAVQDMGDMNTLGVIMGDGAFMVLGSYGDDRVYEEPSPVYLASIEQN